MSGAEVSAKIVEQFVRACHGNIARVKKLVRGHPALIHARSAAGESGIEAAAHTGQRDIVQFLLDQGARLDICTAAMLGRERDVERLLRANLTLGRATGAHGIPVMAFAAIAGSIAVAELLFAHGAPINGGDGVMTPLHAAVLFNQPQMAEWLINRSARLESADYAGRTPLALAQASRHAATLALLTAHAASSKATAHTVPVH